MIDPTLLGLLIALGTLALADSLASALGYTLPLSRLTSLASLPGATTLRRVLYSPTHAAATDEPTSVTDEPQYEYVEYEHIEIDDPDRPFNPLAEFAATFRSSNDDEPAPSLAPTSFGPMTEDDWYAASFAELASYLDGFLDRRLPLALSIVDGGDAFAAEIDAYERERSTRTAELRRYVSACTTRTGEYRLVSLAEALLVS